MFSAPLWLRRRRRRTGIAFAERYILAASLARSGRGWIASASCRQELPEGLIVPSASELNIRSVSELARLAEKALQGVGFRGGPAAVILPDLAIRAFVLQLEASSAPAELFTRVAPRLPYPRSEAVFDVWLENSSWALAAAVRRRVLRQYEQALEALGCRPSWVNGASLVLVPEWAHSLRLEAGRSYPAILSVQVQLYPRHYTLAVFRGSEMLDLRYRLRRRDDLQRVLEDIARLPAFHPGVDGLTVTAQGDDAASLIGEISGRDLAPGGARLAADGEEAHLTGLIVSLAGRM